jgi:hypothetical protein
MTLQSREEHTMASSSFYALRSLKTGRFFHFTQYCDDGWGEYIDDVSLPLREDDLPSLFTHHTMFETDRRGYPWAALRGHDHVDVEIVRVRISIEAD